MSRWLCVTVACVVAFAVAACDRHGTSASPNPASATPDPTPKLSAVSAQAVFIVDVNGLLLCSKDGGASWEARHLESFRLWWRIAFSDERRGWVVGKGADVSRTTDGGTTWTASAVPVDGTLYDVSCAGGEQVWAVGSRPPAGSGRGVVLTTSGGGATWRTRASPGRLDTIAAVDARHAWAVRAQEGSSHVFATADGGARWRRQYSPPEAVVLTGIAFADDHTGWAVGQNVVDETGLVVATTDGGAHWSEQAAPAGRLWGVTCIDAAHAWCAGDDGLVLATTDGGATWTRQELDTSDALDCVTFSDAQHGWALGRTAGSISGRAYSTRDGGTSWAKVELAPDGGFIFVDIVAVPTGAQ